MVVVQWKKFQPACVTRISVIAKMRHPPTMTYQLLAFSQSILKLIIILVLFVEYRFRDPSIRVDFFLIHCTSFLKIEWLEKKKKKNTNKFTLMDRIFLFLGRRCHFWDHHSHGTNNQNPLSSGEPNFHNLGCTLWVIYKLLQLHTDCTCPLIIIVVAIFGFCLN
jgi:hypothetical protein